MCLTISWLVSAILLGYFKNDTAIMGLTISPQDQLSFDSGASYCLIQIHRQIEITRSHGELYISIFSRCLRASPPC